MNTSWLRYVGENPRDVLYCRSWCGFGWTCHLGRIVTKQKWVPGTIEYSNSETVLEMPSGRTYRFFPNQKSAFPNLSITHFPDCTGTDLPPGGGDPPDRWNCCIEGTCDPDSPQCTGESPDVCAGREDDPIEHYVVVDEQGTRYRYERVVEETTPTPTGYVDNLDRAGFYVVSRTDSGGNEIRVRYWQRSCLNQDTPPEGGWPADCAQAYPAILAGSH